MMVVRIMTCLVVCVVVALANVAASPAVAQGAFVPTAQDKPLVIVRFNQPRVNYGRAMRRAINEALRTDRNMRFHVMSFVPTNERGIVNAVDQQRAGEFSAMISNSIMRMNVPQTAISASQQPSPLVGSHEVHVFVH